VRVIKSCWRWLPAAALGLACLMPDPVARVHAGEVAASLDNGVLTLVGSADPDALLITGGPNIVVVTALGETRFPSMGRRGSRVLTFRDVTGVTFDGLSGDDSLNVFADLASLEFLGGDDHDSLFAVVGAADILHVDAGAGSDNLYVSATAAALTMDLGPDNDAATISNSTLGMLTISDAGATEVKLTLEATAKVMPELFGLALSTALDRLQAAGIALTRLMDFEGTDYAPANPGKERLGQPVLAQSPVAGTLLESSRAAGGAAVVIAVPAELESVVEVPSLAGLTQDEAKRVLENLGLRLGKVTVLQPRT